MNTNFNFIIGFAVAMLLANNVSFAQAEEGDPVLPYRLKSKKGKIKIHAFPYTPFSQNTGVGETYVFRKRKELYVIPKYISNPIFTYAKGDILVELKYNIMFNHPMSNQKNGGNVENKSLEFDGNVVTIYKSGKLFESIHFSDLGLDTNKFEIHTYHHEIDWRYICTDSSNEKLVKIGNQPYHVNGNILSLFTIDDEWIQVDIETGLIIDHKDIKEFISSSEKLDDEIIEKKFEPVMYPKKFTLPRLASGKSLKNGLSLYLNKLVAINYRDSAHVQIYVHELLVSKDGKCLEVDVSVSTRKNSTENFGHIFDEKLKEKIEKWIMGEMFISNSTPVAFPKFNFYGFIYFK